MVGPNTSFLIAIGLSIPAVHLLPASTTNTAASYNPLYLSALQGHGISQCPLSNLHL